ncbi:MAG: TonB-dependent receptor plug domain-containing protein [Pseudomonadota bacterium]
MSRVALNSAAFLTAFLAGAPALANEATPGELARLSLEELVNLEITAVSKRPERLADAAASVFVIGGEDVRRSGVQSLAEALRLAPNLNVQQIDALDYGISARGLNGFESANKLLVLVDGRTVYSPFFGGVEWSQLHPPLVDLNRIEVVSGPGGALWGANAVNGVVNVVSKPAEETLGGLVQAIGGTGDDSLTLRYGGLIGDHGAFRVHVGAYDRADTLRGGADAGDGWNGAQIGFRTDFAFGGDRLTLQGGAYDDDVPSGVPARPQGKLEGYNLVGRWTRTFESGATFELQAWYDRYERRARGILDGVITWDVQGQHTVSLGRHDVVVGAGYRAWNDKFANYVNAFVLDPPSRDNDLVNAFVQDQIRLGAVTLTLGVKGEHNSFSGTEWLPSVRAAWRLSETSVLWAAASRAVRNPSRLDRELVFPPFLLGSNFQPEELVAYEFGWRGRPAPHLSLSATAFHHRYDGLRSVEPTPGTVFPLRIGNGLEGETWGLEAWGDLDVSTDWRLSGGLTLLAKDIRASPGSADRSALAAAGHDPDYYGYLRSRSRLTDRLDLDVRLRFAGETPRERTGGYRDAPAYVDADARLAWRLNDHAELSLAGFNLLDESRPEATEPRRMEVRRSVQLGLRVDW